METIRWNDIQNENTKLKVQPSITYTCSYLTQTKI